MPDKWAHWFRGRPKANLKNGEPPPWTRGGVTAEEVATAIFKRLPFQIIGDIEWAVIRNSKDGVTAYTLQMRGGHSNLVLHQKDQLTHIHGMSINPEGTVNFGLGFDDRLSVQIYLVATK